MMLLNIYSIYDNKAKAFSSPFYMQNDEVAKRVFHIMANNPESDYYHHPDDFILYHIGAFEDGTAAITQIDPIQNLGVASSFKEPEK